MSDTLWMLVLVGAMTYSIGYFMGFRSGWRSGAKANEKLPADASAAINHMPAGSLRPSESSMSSLIAAAEGKSLPPAPVSIGDRFTYMGLQMLCVSHSIRMPLGVMAPGMSAEYIDVDGLVRGHYWTPEQYGAVRAELARRGERVA